MRIPTQFFAAFFIIVIMLNSVEAENINKPVRLGLCAACHGENGIAVSKEIPNLTGQNADYLRTALGAYRSGKRDVAAMRTASGSLTDVDIDELARWYAAQPFCRELSRP